ncbi:MAG: Rne/Rng family ribonuclease [Prochloraceae cyanobacterium]
MAKQIVIAEQHHIAAVFWEDRIQELVVATGIQQVSDIYLGVVENVIPGIDAAFVNIGDADRNGFIHVTDLGPLRLKKGSGAITELLEPQQKVLVQVMKEPTGNKGPRLTGNITLPGRYLVLMPHGQGVKLSRRIKDETERSRLRALAILIKPAGMGLLVRTEAETKDEKAIMEDLDLLQKQWEKIQQQANRIEPPALLNRDDDFIQRVLRDMYTADVNRIVVDSNGGLKRVKEQLRNWGGGRPPAGVSIDHHRERQRILEYFRVNAAIKEALKPRVDLPSGGYIIIEPTEALTVIDVNSGSFTRSATARETVLWTNSEAATEIARQLRLRNIGGVIVVDFIDMDSARDRLKLLEHFDKALKADKARPQIAQLSELGLVELTRKRQGQNIYELFSTSCPSCGGLGHLAHLPGESLELALVSTNVNVPAAATFKTPELALEEAEEAIEPVLDLSSSDNVEQPELADRSGDREVAAGNNNNRRRRRRRLNDVTTKEESPTTVVEPPRLSTTESLPEPEIDSSEEKKTKISSRSRRDEEALEKISLEMSAIEQDVYALMGVSPLIKLEGEYKDPKSAIVSIVSAKENDLEAKEVNNEDNQPDAPILTLEHPESELSAEELSPELDLEDNDESPDNPRPVIRRRRRRSSAKESQTN